MRLSGGFGQAFICFQGAGSEDGQVAGRRGANIFIIHAAVEEKRGKHVVGSSHGDLRLLGCRPLVASNFGIQAVTGHLGQKC